MIVLLKHAGMDIKMLAKAINPEAFLWIGAFGFILLINPHIQCEHSLCLFKNLGFDFCPGCGLGRSISLLFQGDVAGSIQMHPLGIPALIIILLRIIKLLRNSKEKPYMKTGGWNG